jgi:hypothetical protein
MDENRIVQPLNNTGRRMDRVRKVEHKLGRETVTQNKPKL